MRCPERLRAASLAVALLAAGVAGAAPNDVREALVERFKAQLPQVAPGDYALGAAAFDAELRAQEKENAGGSAALVDAGRAIWTRKFRNGRSLAGCFPNGGRRVAATYPHFDSRLKIVVTLEMAINRCLKAHGEALMDPTDSKTMGATLAYLRSLANGQKVRVRVPQAAEGRFEQGRQLYFSRLGQRNYACASCHVQGAGKRFGDTPLSTAIGQATHWPVLRRGEAVTLQARIRECLEIMGAAPFPAGSEELNNLEYFLTYLSNGLPVTANAWRP
jgi:sulfur-oxidizing protein SoxA